MEASWIIVANSARAKLFNIDSKTHSLEQIDEWVHDESRSHQNELVSDRQGRTYDSAGSGRHAIEQQLSPQEREAVIFARQIAARLHAKRNAHEFVHLDLAAPPAFLGILRKSLDKNVADATRKVIDKNLLDEEPDKIYNQFRNRQ